MKKLNKKESQILNQKQIKFLEELGKSFIHGKNILSKKNKSHIQKFFNPYKEFNASLNKNLPRNLTVAVKALNTYKDSAKVLNTKKRGTYFSSQSKLESTILEEFICQVLKKTFGNETLQYGNVKAYSSLYFHYTNKESFKNDLKVKLNEKDQDVGIYKKITLTIDDEPHDVSIPIVCIECKTYLDKTMLEGSVATAEKIKNGNPKCLFFIVAETYDVKSDVDIETSQIDNIYVLRKQKRGNNSLSDIKIDVVENLIKEIKQRMESDEIPVEEMIRKKGYLRN
ncbi:Bpu10I family restriction endonuclease [Candidatus Mycalebacterium sp.]